MFFGNTDTIPTINITICNISIYYLLIMLLKINGLEWLCVFSGHAFMGFCVLLVMCSYNLSIL